MSATALIPGRLYRVRGPGIDMPVMARNGCTAICNILEALPCK